MTSLHRLTKTKGSSARNRGGLAAVTEGAEVRGQSVGNQDGGSASCRSGSVGVLALERACVVHRFTITPDSDDFGDTCQLSLEF